MPRRTVAAVLAAAVLGSVGLLASPSAAAPARTPPVRGPVAGAAVSTADAASVVATVPQAGTPQVADGAVYAVAQVGATMVIGGSFTQTAAPDPAAPPLATPYVLAFDAATGAVQTGFAPGLDGVVQAVAPGPDPGTVYVGGMFRTAGGAAAPGLVLLRTSDGSRVPGFSPVLDVPNVQTLKLVGSRLYVGGAFTTVSGVAHGGLAALDPRTGAADPFVSSSVALNHTWRPGSPPGTAKAPVGVTRLDVTPDGRTMVLIGNFRQVDGADRDQVATLDLSGAAAVLRPWSTSRLQALCNQTAYDTYVRDVAFSPDGSWFALVNSGGYGPPGALCDSASRWETGATAADVQPTWVDFTGKDTLLSVAVTAAAVYVGGHERWLNNPVGTDFAGPGAVPRPGVGALDPANGMPLAWNPGRTPRGAGTWVLYPTPSGLWMGSDTNYVGVYRYLRPKIAFFPLAGGQAPADKTVPALPGQAVLGTVPAAAPSPVLYRVDAGGPLLRSIDAGPDWAADDRSISPYRNLGSATVQYRSPVPSVDATVPPGTPSALFDDQRYDPGSRGDGHELQWHFAVPAGTQVDVRLYLADRCLCTSTPGSRTFDVVLDGTTRAAGLDVVATAGADTGTMRSWTVTSDGSVDLTLVHQVSDPVVAGIEVVPTGNAAQPRPTGTLATRSFDGSTAGPAVPLGGPLDPATVTAATLVGSTVFYGRTDGNLYRRSLSGGTWGPEVLVDPYDDPTWSTVDTGSGGVYRGLTTRFNTELSNLTSLSYDGKGTLYYTLYKQNRLFSRAFSPDSGTVSPDEATVGGIGLPDLSGAFFSGGSLYYARRVDGSLIRVGFTGSGLSGTATLVSGPAADGVDWRGLLLLLPADAPPVARPTVTCAYLHCSADGTASSDADGRVTAYAWDWGDGATSTGATATHDYATGGTRTVALTVTDDRGASGTATTTLTVAARPASPIGFRGGTAATGTAPSLAVPLPVGVRPGDALVLEAATAATTAATPPAGWAEVARQAFAQAGALAVVYQRVATADDVATGSVTVQSTAPRTSAVLLAYSGTSTTTPVVASATGSDTPLVTSHPAPDVTVPAAGGWVVWLWTDKSSSTAAWTAPPGLVTRGTTYGSGSSYLSALAADEGAASAAGTVAGPTATTDAASRGAAVALVLAPAAP